MGNRQNVALPQAEKMKTEAPGENWQKVKEIFSRALEKDAGQRAAFLASACAGDANLRAEVESWLDSYAEADEFIENPAFSVNRIFTGDAEQTEKHFGNYRIVREIGRGGMGTVFLAERADGEFDQQVALKIVRQTIIDAETENRFRRERQILASLNHPNIARLLDGGVSGAGEPFLVMELVEGRPLVEFADDRNLSTGERLKLFLKICSAVSFAHRNLVVHRDLKPSNILITDEGEPKLLDFGLAKILDLDGDAAQTVTTFRAFTPSYASPEQLRGERVSTVSDIYSLGVVLYELLTGRRPFDYQGKSLEQIIKTATESKAVKPSQIRHPKSRIQNLKGDIDNIISLALRIEPERRYRSIEAFAEDVERHLRGLPVKARPATFRYRAGKFIRRNRISFVAAVLIFLSLVGGTTVSLRQARQARMEKAKAETVDAFLQNMLNYSDPDSNLSDIKDREITVSDVLSDAAKRLENGELNDQPEIKAELQTIIGNSYLSQGKYDLAEKYLRQAVEAKIRIYGENSIETVTAQPLLADILLAKSDFANAEPLFRQILPVLRREQQNGNVKADVVVFTLADFAVLRRARGDSGEAETLLREALALRPSLFDKNLVSIAQAQSTLALALADQGKIDEAEAITREIISEARQNGKSEKPTFGYSLTVLGNYLTEKKNFAEAAAVLSEAEAIYRKTLAPQHLWLGDNLRIQAYSLYQQDKFTEAEIKITEALRIYRESSKSQYINFPTALTIEGLICNRTNRVAEAEKILREAVRIRAENLPREHFLTAFSIGALGECLLDQKRYDEAEPLLLESYKNLEKSQGPDNPRTKIALGRLDKFYKDSGRVRNYAE
jgi:serine/threonine-protein kinase